MSGAWETRKSGTVLVAILHVEHTSVAWAFGLRNLQVPGGTVVGLSGMPFDHARNQGAMMALDCGASHLFFLDSDVICPSNAIVKLLEHQVPIVSGVYYRRSAPAGIPVMQRPLGQWVTQFPANSLIEVDVVGAGCLLVSTELLRKMPAHRPGRQWFDWRVDLKGTAPMEECLSEDFTFCVAAKKKLGVSTLVDTSVICRHVGFSQAVQGGLVPLDSTPVT